MTKIYFWEKIGYNYLIYFGKAALLPIEEQPKTIEILVAWPWVLLTLLSLNFRFLINSLKERGKGGV